MSIQNKVQGDVPFFYNQFMSYKSTNQSQEISCYTVISRILSNVGVRTQGSAFSTSKHWYCSQVRFSCDKATRLNNEVELYLEKNNIQFEKLYNENLPVDLIEKTRFYKERITSLLTKINILDTNFDTYLPDICNQFYIIDLYTKFLLENDKEKKGLALILIRFFIEIDEKRHDNIRRLFSRAINELNFSLNEQSIIEKVLHTLVFPHYIRDENKENILLSTNSFLNRYWNTYFFTYCGLENISREKIIAAIKHHPYFIIFNCPSLSTVFSLWQQKNNTLIEEVQKLSKNSFTQSAIKLAIFDGYINSSQFQLAADFIDKYERIIDKYERNRVCEILVQQYSKYKMYDEAENFFQKIDDHLQIRPLFTVLGVHLKDIEATINSKQHLMKCDDAWASIVRQYAKDGKYDEAEAAIEKIEDVTERSRAWRGIAIEYATDGKYDEAEAAIEKIEDVTERPRAWRGIAIEYATDGKYDEAEAAIEKIEDVTERPQAWRGIAIEYAKDGKYDEAEAIIEKIEDVRERSQAWRGIAIEYATDGKYDEAEAAIEKIEGVRERNDFSKLVLRQFLEINTYRKGSEDDFIQRLIKTYFPDDKALNLAFSVQLNKKNKKKLNIDDIKGFVKKETDYLFE